MINIKGKYVAVIQFGSFTFHDDFDEIYFSHHDLNLHDFTTEDIRAQAILRVIELTRP